MCEALAGARAGSEAAATAVTDARDVSVSNLRAVTLIEWDSARSLVLGEDQSCVSGRAIAKLTNEGDSAPFAFCSLDEVGARIPIGRIPE